jgi:hypothetical protein
MSVSVISAQGMSVTMQECGNVRKLSHAISRKDARSIPDQVIGLILQFTQPFQKDLV